MTACSTCGDTGVLDGAPCPAPDCPAAAQRSPRLSPATAEDAYQRSWAAMNAPGRRGERR